MKNVILLFAFCLAAFFGRSSVNETFEKGNSAYEEGRYEEAITAYQSIVDSGYQSFDLYFNLGNAYYKGEMIPHAILYYEKAQKLEPQDKDVAYNLRLANLQTVDKIDPADSLFLNAWWRTLVNLLPTDGWARWSLVMLYLGLVLLSLYLFLHFVTLKKITFYLGSLAVVIALFCVIMATAQNHRLNAAASGIVFSANVTVRSAPNDDGKELFVIHEGTKVELLQNREAWVEISLANGNAGWIRTSDVEKI